MARLARQEEDARLRRFRDLSAREAEVLDHLLAGRAAEEIAGSLYLSMPTVRMHIQRILRKLGVSSQLAKASAARWAPAKHQSC